jgi:hypothetical protein
VRESGLLDRDFVAPENPTAALASGSMSVVSSENDSDSGGFMGPHVRNGWMLSPRSTHDLSYHSALLDR